MISSKNCWGVNGRSYSLMTSIADSCGPIPNLLSSFSLSKTFSWFSKNSFKVLLVNFSTHKSSQITHENDKTINPPQKVGKQNKILVLFYQVPRPKQGKTIQYSQLDTPLSVVLLHVLRNQTKPSKAKYLYPKGYHPNQRWQLEYEKQQHTEAHSSRSWQKGRNRWKTKREFHKEQFQMDGSWTGVNGLVDEASGHPSCSWRRISNLFLMKF